MKIKITQYFATSLRFKLAENLATQKLRGILTTKYPPEVLDMEFFDDMSKQEKLFLKKYWTTFDIFKPVFEIVNETSIYKGFILYEVKSSVAKKNTGENEKHTIKLSLNQKKFFDTCKDESIPVKFFYVAFLDDWEVEYKVLDYNDAEIRIRPPSTWQEEKIKRIRSSKLSQFWHDLFPDRVLYKVDEGDLDKEQEKQFSEYIQEKARTPLTNLEKEMLIKRAIKRDKSVPKFMSERETNFQKRPLRKKEKINYHNRLAEIKKKFQNAYEPWREEEDTKLREFFSESKSIIEICNLLGRQPSAIQSRLKKLNLIHT